MYNKIENNQEKIIYNKFHNNKIIVRMKKTIKNTIN